MGNTQKFHLFLLLSFPLFLILAALSSQVSAFTTDFPELIDKPQELLSEERVFQLFQEWKQKHRKIYKNEKEEEMRLENFKRNVKYIVDKNSKRRSESDHLVGLNNFADMSNEEFSQVHTSKIKMPFNQQNKTAISANSCVAPPSKDWRKHGVVTEVKNQGACGCCWAFSACGAIEGINALVTGELISLSTQELVSCDTANKGCEGGLMDPAFKFVINNRGIDSAADYPYTESRGTCSYNKLNKKVVTIDGYQDVAQDESALLCAVARQPVSVGIDGKGLDFQLYAGGIYDGECSSNPDDLSHAVLIVGYGSEGGVDYWIIKNSWGKFWGMEGYAYIKRNTSLPYGICAINSLASYPMKESSSTPPSPLVPPPPSPKPNICEDGLYYCPEGQTCCCGLDFFGKCLVHGCCPIENGVCCENSRLCCPQDFPYCDVLQGLCHKDYGDKIGVAARKRTIAKLKLPWSSGTKGIEEMDQTFQWKRNQFAVMR
ncbi:low-temperature-induced cysteine proteinase-like [Solanum stenotomum]|uniref:low-temperature-induced cysteine proteinase-like n=1 Tax=Solanum stenotomum TaxID=172797 RepID=UPI0020D0D702|nr:low-temperature-induced cysteine proteinase-like [Solanum stenotomum]